MLDLMYDMPSEENLKEVMITEEFITQKGEALKVYEEKKEKFS